MVREAKSDFEPRDRYLTAAVLAPPLIWFAHLNISYALVPSYCESPARWGLHLLAIAGVAMTATVGWFSWRNLQTFGTGPIDGGDAADTRRRFMAILGTTFAPAFGILIIAGEVANLVMRSCG